MSVLNESPSSSLSSSSSSSPSPSLTSIIPDPTISIVLPVVLLSSDLNLLTSGIRLTLYLRIRYFVRYCYDFLSLEYQYQSQIWHYHKLHYLQSTHHLAVQD